MRRFWPPETNVWFDEYENIHNFSSNKFGYLRPMIRHKQVIWLCDSNNYYLDWLLQKGLQIHLLTDKAQTTDMF